MGPWDMNVAPKPIEILCPYIDQYWAYSDVVYDAPLLPDEGAQQNFKVTVWPKTSKIPNTVITMGDSGILNFL